MIVLRILLSPKQGEEQQLEETIRRRFLPAMSRQPGFIRGELLTPFTDDRLPAGIEKLPFQFHVAALWNSEEERLAWVARDIHQEVFGAVQGLSAEVSASLFDVAETWPSR